MPRNAYSFRTMIGTLGCLLSLSATAGPDGALFSVQVGAYASPAQGLRESLTEYGSVTIDNSGALSRYLVGNFNSRGEAELLRDELRAAGFDDAFVRSIGTATQGHAHDDGVSGKDQSLLSKLTAEQRANAVYLDGVLHLKNGDNFTPLR